MKFIARLKRLSTSSLCAQRKSWLGRRLLKCHIKLRSSTSEDSAVFLWAALQSYASRTCRFESLPSPVCALHMLPLCLTIPASGDPVSFWHPSNMQILVFVCLTRLQCVWLWPVIECPGPSAFWDRPKNHKDAPLDKWKWTISYISLHMYIFNIIQHYNKHRTDIAECYTWTKL